MPELKGREAATFILGYIAALTMQRAKPRLSKRLLTAGHEAMNVLTGGSFRGLLAVYNVESLAQELAAKAARKAKVQP